MNYQRTVLFFSLFGTLFLAGCLFSQEDATEEFVSRSQEVSEEGSAQESSQTSSETTTAGESGSIETSQPEDSIEETTTEPSSEQVLPSQSISISTPLSGALLASPVVISGIANVESDVVYVDVKKENGDVVISEKVSVHEYVQGQKTFQVSINFQFSHTLVGFIEVYTLSEGAQKENVQQIPVKFETSL